MQTKSKKDIADIIGIADILKAKISISSRFLKSYNNPSLFVIFTLPAFYYIFYAIVSVCGKTSDILYFNFS